jgi:hypothetical protein
MEKSKFLQEFENRCSVRIYNELHDHLLISRKKLTRLLQGSDPWSWQQLQALAGILNWSPAAIVATGISNNITLDQMATLADWWMELCID